MEEDEDHYVIYGHALPEIDEEGASSKKLKPVPIEEQIVTDENGRRRFHGAFTGGFSAGFFNTAGSRDGWTPKNFKSTRENRFQSNEQKPEDFMDDDDMGEFGIAPQKLQTSSKFRDQNEKKRKHEKPSFDGQPIPGDPVLEQFIKPSEDTIGNVQLQFHEFFQQIFFHNLSRQIEVVKSQIAQNRCIFTSFFD